MKGTIKILDGSGHTAVAFDTETGVVEAAEEILVAADRARSAVFDGTTKERVNPATVTTDPSRVLREHEELIVVPAMAGGA